MSSDDEKVTEFVDAGVDWPQELLEIDQSQSIADPFEDLSSEMNSVQQKVQENNAQMNEVIVQDSNEKQTTPKPTDSLQVELGNDDVISDPNLYGMGKTSAANSKMIQVESAETKEESKKTAVTSKKNAKANEQNDDEDVGAATAEGCKRAAAVAGTAKVTAEKGKKDETANLMTTGSNRSSESSLLASTTKPEVSITPDSNTSVVCEPKEKDKLNFSPTPDFEPVIALPEIVEVKTGEENERVLFEQRAQLLW